MAENNDATTRKAGAGMPAQWNAGEELDSVLPPEISDDVRVSLMVWLVRNAAPIAALRRQWRAVERDPRDPVRAGHVRIATFYDPRPGRPPCAAHVTAFTGWGGTISEGRVLYDVRADSGKMAKRIAIWRRVEAEKEGSDTPVETEDAYGEPQISWHRFNEHREGDREAVYYPDLRNEVGFLLRVEIECVDRDPLPVLRRLDRLLGSFFVGNAPRSRERSLEEVGRLAVEARLAEDRHGERLWPAVETHLSAFPGKREDS